MNEKIDDDEMLDEYDFTDGVRGKYVDMVAASEHVVVLAPDVAAVFSDSEAVNDALRGLIPVIRKQADKIQPR